MVENIKPTGAGKDYDQGFHERDTYARIHNEWKMHNGQSNGICKQSEGQSRVLLPEFEPTKYSECKDNPIGNNSAHSKNALPNGQ